MSDENKDDKEFEASGQKLARAREQGDVPRSTEINVLAMYIGFWFVFAAIAGFATKNWLAMAERSLGAGGWPIEHAFPLASSLGRYAAIVVIMSFLVPGVMIIVGLVAQRGLIFSGKKVKPDIKRINPIKNAKQKFGPSGLMTFAISLVKVILVCGGGWYIFIGLIDRIATTAFGSGTQWVNVISIVIMKVMGLAIVVSALLAVVDVMWKRHEFMQRQRMSRKEMEDEHKNSEGDPHLKAARRRKAVDIAMKQMLSDVEKADVIIVNPTHYAVALKWNREAGRVPVCVAKGTDDVAARIRDRAAEHKVPIFSDPPTARSLHATVKIGEEIRREHYFAVAAAIRFAENMRKKARAGW